MRLLSIFLIPLTIIFLIAPKASASEHVAIQLKWSHHFQFAGYYAALEKGFYKEVGLDVEIREGGPSIQVEDEVISGNADFGVGTSALLLHRAKGRDLVSVAQIFQHSPAVILALQNKGFKSPADLKGKRLMYSNQHGDILALLKRYGIEESDFVAVPHHGDPRELLSGKADAMIAYSFNEPYIIRQEGKPYTIFSPLAGGIDFYGDNLFTRKSFAEKNPDTVNAFKSATIKGWRYALTNKDEIVDLILSKYSNEKSREWLKFEADEIDSLMQHDIVEIGHQNHERWEIIAKTFASIGLLQKNFSSEGTIYSPPSQKDYRLAFIILSVSLVIITVIIVISASFVKLNRKLKKEITEKERAATEAEDNALKLRILFDTLQEAVFVTDASTGMIIECNSKLSGYSAKELVGSTSLEKQLWVSLDERQKVVETVKANGRISDMEAEFRKKSGEIFTGSVSSNIVDLDGKLLFLTVVRDISERKKAEQEHKDMEVQLLQAQKLESLGILAGGIAHDFNNILMVILGNAEIARMRIDPNSPAIDNLKKIETSSSRAADLARQMLAYSGRGKLVVTHLNMNILINEMLKLLQVSISKSVLLRLNLIDGIPAVKGDATQLRQIVMNMVINASESIGEKSGTITISTGVMDCDKKYLHTVWLDPNLEEGRYLTLEVSDDGCGMDKDTQSKLFDPFFTTKFTGRGLGMSSLLGIVRRHKGAVKVYSEKGKGTTFRILLPSSSEEPANEEVNDKKELETFVGEGTVLLVDDEESVRSIGNEMLSELGYSVITACDGREALDILALNNGIKLVLLDMTMPRMGGEECFREIRKRGIKAPVIICSGYSEVEVSEKFIGKGVAGFVQKPYNISSLVDVFKSLGNRDSDTLT